MHDVQGLKYLHDSPLKVHGRLKSSNVVVDGRWVCKLMDYGLHKFREGQKEDPDVSEHKRYSSMSVLYQTREFVILDDLMITNDSKRVYAVKQGNLLFLMA